VGPSNPLLGPRFAASDLPSTDPDRAAGTSQPCRSVVFTDGFWGSMVCCGDDRSSSGAGLDDRLTEGRRPRRRIRGRRINAGACRVGRRNASRAAVSTPRTEVALKAMVTPRSRWVWPRCASRPEVELTTTMTKDVPTARVMSSPSNRTSSGMIRNPPPKPNSPARKPTARPAPSERGRQRRQLILPPDTVQAVPAVP
jgi:hypothetical protein